MATNDNDDDDDAESVQSVHDCVRMEALRMLNLADNRDGSTERRQRERDADRGVAAKAHSFSTKLLNRARQSLVAVSGGGGDHSDDKRVTDNTDPKQRASSLSSRALEEDDVETPRSPRRSRFHFRRARSPVPTDDDNDNEERKEEIAALGLRSSMTLRAVGPI